MKQKFEVEQVDSWLFGGVPDTSFPPSQLEARNHEHFKSKKVSSELLPIGDGLCTSRVKIHPGGITDIRIEDGKRGAVTTSNNGDLLTGCGFAVAKAVINAAGAGLQTELYNRYGVPGVMQVPKAGPPKLDDDGRVYVDPKDKGRGYAISCKPYDMKATHNIDRIEVLTVPMQDGLGVEDMYYDALVHSKDLDYIIFPMAGMTHDVIGNDSNKSAQFTLNAVAKFMKDYPDSKLQVIFTIFNNKVAEANYKKHAALKDKELALSIPSAVVTEPSVAIEPPPVADLGPSPQDLLNQQNIKAKQEIIAKSTQLVASIPKVKIVSRVNNFQMGNDEHNKNQSLQLVQFEFASHKDWDLFVTIIRETPTLGEPHYIGMGLSDQPIVQVTPEFMKNIDVHAIRDYMSREQLTKAHQVSGAQATLPTAVIPISPVVLKATVVPKKEASVVVKVEPETLEPLRGECRVLLAEVSKKLRSGTKDPKMDEYIKTNSEKIEKATSIDLEAIKKKLTEMSKNCAQVERIKDKIKDFREGAAFWKLAVGKNKKADAIEKALLNVDIENRGTAFEDPKVREELAKHRHWGKQGTVYKKEDKLDEENAANSFKELKRILSKESKTSVDDEDSSPGSKP